MKKTTLLLILIFAINFITFLLYAIDKRKAIKRKYRISEKLLLTWSFFAPWGAYAGMNIMHHKTQNQKFTFWVPVFMILHVVVCAVFIYHNVRVHFVIFD